MSGKLSLAPDLLAKPGYRFAFTGPNSGEECDGCPVKRLCFDLQPGHNYEVSEIRDVTHPCGLHEGRMRVVKVVPTTFVTTLEETSLRGTAAKFVPIDCGYAECKNWKLCHPTGPISGDKFSIKEQHESVDCPMDFKIRRVTLAAIDS